MADVREHAPEAAQDPGVGMGDHDVHCGWDTHAPARLPRQPVHWGAHPTAAAASRLAKKWCACGSSLKRSISS
jgi:hypothetical protein